MNTRILAIAVISGLFVSGLESAYASGAALEGMVRDSKWHPIKNAVVRIEAKSGQFTNTVKTDVKGHYWCENLEPGAYRVTLLVDGSVKASINNARAVSGESRRLDFDLTGRLGAKATHLVYMPIEKASNLGGHWVSVDAHGHLNNVSVDNVQTLNGIGPHNSDGMPINAFMHVNAPNYQSDVPRAQP